MSAPKHLYRSNKNRMIAGVCVGLAEYFNLDPTLVRLAVIFLSLLPGPSVIFYLIAWVVIPRSPEA
jgi:phage shock protein C